MMGADRAAVGRRGDGSGPDAGGAGLGDLGLVERAGGRGAVSGFSDVIWFRLIRYARQR